jgi:hypothetical protein
MAASNQIKVFDFIGKILMAFIRKLPRLGVAGAAHDRTAWG